jgi:beta-lactamase class A
MRVDRSWFVRRCAAHAASCAVLILLVLVPTSSGAAPTPAVGQLDWVLAKLNDPGSPPRSEIVEHMSSSFLGDVPPAQMSDLLASIGAARPVRIAQIVGNATSVALTARLHTSGPDLRLSISVAPAPPHKIESLWFKPVDASPAAASWSSVRQALAGFGSQVSVLAAPVVRGQIGPALFAQNADVPAAVGSAFKLYVLGALAQAVGSGHARWDEQLAVRDRWKSLPSGTMQNDAAGAHFALRYYAEQAISESDNTATDHLIGRLGKATIERELLALGNRSAGRDRPFLTTREAFALKLVAPTALRDAFTQAGPARRARLLAKVDALSLKDAASTSWIAPRQIQTIEWYASASDLARAIVGLEALARQPGLSPVRSILALNPGIALDPSRWLYAAFKGGYEPGVSSGTWYLERADGKAFVLSVVANDPAHSTNEIFGERIAESAIALLARA